MDPRQPFHTLLINTVGYHASQRPNSPAFISASADFPDVSFKHAYDSMLATAKFFYNDLGLKKGDVVSIAMPNTWYYIPYYLGASTVGAVSTGINPMATQYEIAIHLKSCTPTVLLTTAENVEKILGIQDDLSFLKYILYIGTLPERILTHDHIKLINFDECINGPTDFDINTVKIDTKEDLLFLPYSSGTTGLPKGVMITHSNYLHQLMILGIHMKTLVDPFFPPNQNHFETAVQYLPFYHTYGYTGLCAKFLKGDTTVIISKFTPEILLSVIEKYQVVQVNMIPSLFDFMASPSGERFNLGSVRSVACGGAPLSSEQVNKLHQRLPNLQYVLLGYGMTELCSASHMTVFNEPTPCGAVGKLLQFMEQRVIDPQTKQQVGPNERGELWVRGPTVMKGYWRDEAATKEALTEDGFMKTGDLVYLDDNGFIFVVDRLKELIKVNEIQVPPAELEQVLKQHPKIKNVAVIGVPHSASGEAPRAYIVKNDDNLDENEIKQFVAERLSAHKHLTGGIEFIKEIPRTPTGKILRRKLKENYLQQSKL